tara:strand:- start:2989 stop:3219 length:231 start_codon:yes stop_codon:yes gene_type:complete
MNKTELKKLESIIKTQLTIIKNRIDFIKNKEKNKMINKVDSLVSLQEDYNYLIESDSDFELFSDEYDSDDIDKALE